MRTRKLAQLMMVAAAMALLLVATPASARCTAESRDADRDELPNCLERQLGTSRRGADTDHDGLSDGLEVSLGTNPTRADSDDDGHDDGDEETSGHDPMDADDHEDDGPQVEIRSPLDAVDPVAATVSVLTGRLTIDASHAELDGALDMADLKAKLDAAVAVGKTLEVEVEVDPASLAGGGLLVADEIEVQEKQEEADVRCCTPDDDEGNECEERSVAECTAHGGLDLGPGSCEPNPCP